MYFITELYIVLCCVVLCLCLSVFLSGVGDVKCSTISYSILHDALALYQQFVFYNLELLQLEACAKLIYDLRVAQLTNKWFDESKTETALSETNDMLINQTLTSSKQFRYSVKATEASGTVNWLLHRGDVDRDMTAVALSIAKNSSASSSSSSSPSQVPTVLDVLEGADYVRRMIGLSPVVEAELQLARRELGYRQLSSKLLIVLTRLGYQGSPGALDNSQLDMYRSKRILEHDVKNHRDSVVKEVKWMVRDAALIYRARVARNTKDWSGLHNVIQEGKLANVYTLGAYSSSTSQQPREDKCESERVGDVETRQLLPIVW